MDGRDQGVYIRRRRRAMPGHDAKSSPAIAGAPVLPRGVQLALDHQLLHAPGQDFGDVDFVLGRAGNLVHPTELFRLFARLAEPAEHFAVEADLVDAAREGIRDECDLLRSRRDADRPWRARRLRAAFARPLAEIGLVADRRLRVI